MVSHQAHPDTEEIWRRLSNRLRQFIQSRIRSAADTEDILQSVFLRIHQNLAGLQRRDRLESWVFQIARNAIADHYRRQPNGQPEIDSTTVPCDNGEPENLNVEVAGCISSLIERIPSDLRRAVWMYEREGVTQQEIASREGISLSGAKSRVQRGRKALKRVLEECCQFQFDRYGNVLSYNSTADRAGVDGACECR